jgi:hypothetical protein
MGWVQYVRSADCEVQKLGLLLRLIHFIIEYNIFYIKVFLAFYVIVFPVVHSVRVLQ